jgi:hypothetical protein
LATLKLLEPLLREFAQISVIPTTVITKLEAVEHDFSVG